MDQASQMNSNDLFTKLVEFIKSENEKTKQDINNTFQTETNKIISCIEQQNKKIETLEKNYKSLENKYLVLERQIRKNNIIIFGLAPTEQENLATFVLEELNNLLQTTLSESDLNNIYVLKTQNGTPIKLEFTSYLKKQQIFQNLSKLKGTKISIVHDQCYEDRVKTKVLTRHLKEARSKSYLAKIKGQKLIINGVAYEAEELEGNSSTNSPVSNNIKSGQNIKPSSAPQTPSHSSSANYFSTYPQITPETSTVQQPNKKRKAGEEKSKGTNSHSSVQTRLQTQLSNIGPK